MYLLEGVIAILAAIGLYGWAYAYNHRPDAPLWARGQFFASVMSLILVCITPIGAGLVAKGFEEPMTTLSWAGVALLAIVPVGLWRVLRG